MDANELLQQKSPEELCSIIKQLQSNLSSQEAQIKSRDQEITKLRHQLNEALRQRFGRKSEKLHPNQMSLFDEANEPENKEEIEQADESITVAAHKRRKKPGKGPLPKNLPRVTCIHDLPEGEKVCGCGCTLSKIGEQVSEQLDIIPAKVQVLQHVRYKYACKSCEGNLKTAKVWHPIPRSIASAGLLAHVATSKFCDHQPLYRQEKIFQRMGVDIPRNTLSHWMIKAGDLLKPLYKLLVHQLILYDVAYADETRVQVLDEPGRAAQSKSYMWCFIGGPPDKRSVVYHYNPSRGHQVILDMLDGFGGYLHCDGFSGYDTFAKVNSKVSLIGCWMHCRRKFYEVAQSSKKQGLAAHALKQIAKLYQLEKDMKAQSLHHEQVKEQRQRYAKPILDDLKAWLDEHSLSIPPKSPLGEAFGYAFNQWQKLNRYLDDGRLEMDNGLSERQIKPFVIGRKNWLFNQSVKGVKAAETIYSFIESAKLNGLEPYTYLRALFTHMPKVTTEAELETLLPFNITADKLIT